MTRCAEPSLSGIPPRILPRGGRCASLRRHDVDSGARELPRPDAHRVIASFGVAEWVFVAVGTLFLLGMIFRTLDQSL